MNKPVVLTIAGSDSGGGAGIQADLRTMTSLGAYATSAITSLTSQNPLTVTHIESVSPMSVFTQIKAVIDFFEVSAIKTGMLCNEEVMASVWEALKSYDGTLVMDPVMISTSGIALIDSSAIESLKEKMFTRANWITPNIPEAELLLNKKLTSERDCVNAAYLLAGMIQGNVLLKGGHSGGERAVDWCVCDEKVYEISTPRLKGRPYFSHGTGCTLASALATLLAKGETSLDAVIKAKTFVYRSLENCVELKEGVFQMYPPSGVMESCVDVKVF